MTFSKNSHTIIDYPTLRYSIYKYKSGPALGVSTYKKIAEFTCTSNSIVYANSLLDNGISHYLTITLPSNLPPPDSTTLNSNGFGLSNSFAFTTDNYKGTYCGEAPPSGK